MNASRNPNDLPADVRAAISSFLKACQNEARPFATKEALEAIRNIFPDLDINDSDLIDGLISEASVAGFDVGIAEETGKHSGFLWIRGRAKAVQCIKSMKPDKRNAKHGATLSTIPLERGGERAKPKSATGCSESSA